MKNTKELDGITGVTSLGNDRYEAYLSIAGLGRVALGTYTSASAAGIAHDDAKLLAAKNGLTAKAPHRQKYNHPDRAKRIIASGNWPEVPKQLEQLQNRLSTRLASDLSVPPQKLRGASKVLKQYETRLAAAEARVAALEARLGKS